MKPLGAYKTGDARASLFVVVMVLPSNNESVEKLSHDGTP